MLPRTRRNGAGCACLDELVNGNSVRVAAMIVALNDMSSETSGGPAPVSYSDLYSFFDAVRHLQPDLALQPQAQSSYRECFDRALKVLWLTPGSGQRYSPATIAEPNPELLNTEDVRQLTLKYRMFLASPPTRYDWIRHGDFHRR